MWNTSAFRAGLWALGVGFSGEMHQQATNNKLFTHISRGFEVRLCLSCYVWVSLQGNYLKTLKTNPVFSPSVNIKVGLDLAFNF